MQKCNRLSSLLSSLGELKHGGISQLDLCQIMIHLLRLLSATVVIVRDPDADANKSETETETGKDHAEIYYDNVGFLYDTTSKKMIHNINNAANDSEAGGNNNAEQLETESYLSQPFALPTPARESLLSVVISLLTTDELLRAVSNTSFRAPADDNFDVPFNGDLLLVINWKAMLRMLLRTSPYLDENKSGGVPLDSLSRQSTVLKRTVLLIRYLRRFYNQGLEVKDNILTDETANEVWDMVQSDLLHQTHTHACYRALIIMYLFQPSRCSKEFYIKVVPKWLESWTSIDRCPDFDFLWLTMFCRARKYLGPDDYDWGTIRRRLLTLCGYWLQIPVGGKSSDKSFPTAAKAKSRSIPARLKAFVGNPSSYQEGVDFVSKLSKLLMFCLGKNDHRLDKDAQSTPAVATAANDRDASQSISDGTEDVLRFLSFVSPYFHPSNTGAWTFPLGVLLHYISYEFCRRLARQASQKAIMKKYPLLAVRVGEIEPYKEKNASFLPDNEIVLVLDSLLPLCQQTLYSKSSQVARAGESALLYLTQIDHKICPMFLDFAMRALDISSVTLSHQAPAALSALSRLVPPSLKTNPSFFLERLPEILRLTLAGIDSNDQSKTVRTLIFYRTLTSWIPIGKPAAMNFCSSSWAQEKGTWGFGKEIPDAVREVSDSKEYWAALRSLPKNSLLYQAETAYEMEHEEEKERLLNLLEEAAFALGDWALSFLERIYDILRAAGEQEKTGKSHGIASRHSSADASEAKHFTMLLKQCLSQVFSAMDDKNFSSAANSVHSFIQSETLPLAVKYASILCEAVCATRTDGDKGNHSPGLDILLPLLVRDLLSKSKATILYRVRCLAGAIRQSGSSALKHREEIFSVLRFTLYEQSDKKIFKAGCKMLRHLLSSQCESYPIASDSCARLSENHPLGKPSHLSNDHVRWHVPTGKQIDFAAEIITQFTYKSIRSLSISSNKAGSITSDFQTGQNFDLLTCRNCLKILRYSLRGAAGILPEPDQFVEDVEDTANRSDPNEISTCTLLKSASTTTQKLLYSSRVVLSKFIVTLLSLIACGSESAIDNDVVDVGGTETNVMQKRTLENMIASDAKICKEAIQISTLLSIRRGSSTHCQETKATWKLQKGLATDRVLSTAREEICTVLRKAGRMNPPTFILYNDGEEGGKSYPRRMLIGGVYIFLQMIQRHSSFQIPRRLKDESEKNYNSEEKAFTFETRFGDLNAITSSYFNFEDGVYLAHSLESTLPFYEGMIDGGFALACHTNAQIRTNGSRMVENLFTRFGWFAKDRVERLISSLSLDDKGRKGQYGLLSSADLSAIDSTSSRKRLAEVLKGVSNLLHNSKVNKELIQSEQHRLSLVRTMCRSQRVMSLLPSEEIKKMTHYYHGIFSKYRSRHFSLPRVEERDINLRRRYLDFLVGELRDNGDNIEVSGEFISAHWRDRLTSAWFLFTFIDKEDMTDAVFLNIIWDTCFICLKETGQPLQKLSLGLIGRMCTLSSTASLQTRSLENRLSDREFCVEFCKAFVFNHKEDSSIGGGHKAQWSIGVSSMLKDAQSNIAPRSIFPFKRMGRSSGTLMIQHAQLLSSLHLIVGRECAVRAANHFLSYAKELASSPPSEDQRNQICTSAEVFAGVSHALLAMGATTDDCSETWVSILLPFFDSVMDIIPSSYLASFSDALRFAIQNLSPLQQWPIIDWVIKKIEKTLWRSDDVEVEKSGLAASDGFAEQSKWVGIMCAILMELDNRNTISKSWYTNALSTAPIEDGNSKSTSHTLEECWSNIIDRLLPRMLTALGHPYQKCREQVAWCLFNICNCYSKLKQQSRHYSRASPEGSLTNPGDSILKSLSVLAKNVDATSKEQQLCLTTARFFMFYCLHYGDNKNEYADFIIPLVPLAFEAIKPDSHSDEAEIDSEVRMLQAQVIKGYRYSIAEISASCFVTYNNTDDITKILKSLDLVSHNDAWQVRHAAAHFLRSFQGCHKFLFTEQHTKKTTRIVSKLLADDRKEVSAAVSSESIYFSNNSFAFDGIMC